MFFLAETLMPKKINQEGIYEMSADYPVHSEENPARPPYFTLTIESFSRAQAIICWTGSRTEIIELLCFPTS